MIFVDCLFITLLDLNRFCIDADLSIISTNQIASHQSKTFLWHKYPKYGFDKFDRFVLLHITLSKLFSYTPQK